MAVAGAFRGAPMVDEILHVVKLRNYLTSGWYALNGDLAAPGGPAGPGSTTFVYGPVSSLLLHLLNVVFGNEGWRDVSVTAAAYHVRHVGVALIGLAGAAAAAATTRALTGSWRWASLTAATLLALPMWTGHAMFNIKDIPVASGYAIFTLGLVLMAGRPRLWRPVAASVVALGAILMVGTRPGMWPAVVVGAVVLCISAVVARSARQPGPRLLDLVVALVVAYAVLVVVYPHGFGHPGRILSTSSQESAAFAGHSGYPLYLPKSLISLVPLVLLALSVVGTVMALVRIVAGWRTSTVEATRLALVGAQLTAFPVAIVITNAYLTHGLREVLFFAPAWAVMTTLGVVELTRRLHATAGVIAAVGLALPLAAQAMLFPYQYGYYNLVGDKVYHYAGTDFWRTSYAELIGKIPTGGPVVCEPMVIDGVAQRWTDTYTYGLDDCATNPLGPIAASWKEQGLPVANALPANQFYVLLKRKGALPANCSQVATVTRPVDLVQRVLTRAALCTDG